MEKTEKREGTSNSKGGRRQKRTQRLMKREKEKAKNWLKKAGPRLHVATRVAS